MEPVSTGIPITQPIWELFQRKTPLSPRNVIRTPVILQTATVAGFPVAMNATSTLRSVLTERDRGRLSYLAKVDFVANDIPHLAGGIPVTVEFSTVSTAQN